MTIPYQFTVCGCCGCATCKIQYIYLTVAGFTGTTLPAYPCTQYNGTWELTYQGTKDIFCVFSYQIDAVHSVQVELDYDPSQPKPYEWTVNIQTGGGGSLDANIITYFAETATCETQVITVPRAFGGPPCLNPPGSVTIGPVVSS